MSRSSLLDLPYVMPAQSQKHVTVNEAFRHLDAIIHMAIQSRTQSAPPSDAEDGMRYSVPDAAADAWAGQAGKIAAYQDGAWAFYNPQKGWVAWFVEEAMFAVYDGENWINIQTDISMPEIPSSFAQVGVNTQADSYNKVAVKSDSVLISHDDVTPGSGNVHCTVNKSTADNVASLIFQTGYAGRAEIGTLGDDGLKMRVSDDGGSWKTALKVDAETGAVSLPQNKVPGGLFNMLKDGGRFAGNPEPSSALAPGFALPGYLNALASVIFSEGPKFIDNNDDHGGTAGGLDPEIKALAARLKDPQFCRYGVEYFTLRVSVGSQISGTSVHVDGVDYFPCISNSLASIPPQFTLGWHVRALSGSVCIQDVGTSQILRDGYPVSSLQRVYPNNGWQYFMRLFDVNPMQHSGYEPDIFSLYAETDTVFLLAHPFLTPGHLDVKPGEIFGPIVSLESWG